jgi:hypothetical protein
MSGDDGFISRWSRRKAEVRQRQGATLPDTEADQARAAEGDARTPSERAVAHDLPLAEVGPAPAPSSATPVEPAPTLDDVAHLPPGAEIGRFLSPSVDEGVKRAAFKKLFADPHFNVMDGLDTYIDDYSKPDPLPLAMLRQLAQAQALGLVDDEAPESPAAATEPRAGPSAEPPKASTDGAPAAAVPQSLDTSSSAVPPDEDPDLRLQQDHAAGRGRAGEGPGA